VGDLFDNPVMVKEIETINSFFEIKNIKKFSEKESSCLALAQTGVEYSLSLGLDSRKDRVKHSF
jgi:hypothetical protein